MRFRGAQGLCERIVVVYRMFWQHLRDELPRSSRETDVPIAGAKEVALKCDTTEGRTAREERGANSLYAAADDPPKF